MTSEIQKQLRRIPQVDKLISRPELKKWKGALAPEVVKRLVQQTLVPIRERILKGEACPDETLVAKALADRFDELFRHHLRRAINATGIVLHTNLGRAPIGKELLLEATEELSGYCTLEIDPESGSRGSRGTVAEGYLSLLFGAEASALVNNNAAAVFLALQALASGREVLISRGEIVQIGGGFRIPEILSASGARLVEVGTTNITKVSDYTKHVTEKSAIILKVHQSNFFVEGHTETPSLEEICKAGKTASVPIVVDLGSGSLKNRREGEVSVQSVLNAGADLVCFSGDKLLGASQAGILVGKKELIEKIKLSPLYRVLRLGKFDLFLLERTLEQHLKSHPSLTQSLLDIPLDELKHRAKKIVTFMVQHGVPAKLVKGEGSIGGGTTPQEILETFLIEIPVENAQKAFETLCNLETPIFVRKSNSKISIDLRTVFPEDEEALIEGIACLF